MPGKRFVYDAESDCVVPVAVPKRRAIAQYRYNGGRPFQSDALGVNPNQVKQANQELRRHGCTAEYQPDGSLEVTSEAQFHQAATISGLRSGRHGYCGGMDENGNPIATGRAVERRKQEFRERVQRGEIDF